VYINPTAEPKVNYLWQDMCGITPCYGIVWGVDDSLKPGESITLRSTPDAYAAEFTRWPGWFAAGTSDLYLLIDAWNCPSETECSEIGAVGEADEGNNLLHLSGLNVTGENPPAPSATVQGREFRSLRRRATPYSPDRF
jgi:hypothetical protein